MSLWRKWVAGFLLVAMASPSWAVVTIEHQAIDCIVRNTHAKVEARYTPEAVTKKRVYFRAPGTEDFYWVELAGAQSETPAAFLPKPHPTTESIEYYVQGEVSATDRAQTEHFAPVVSTMTFCQNEAKNFRQPADNEQVSIVLGLIRWGQAAVPEGFLPSNIASVVLADGTTASISEAMKAGGTQEGASSSAGAGSGGSHALLWTGVGLAAAGGVAVAVGNSGEGDNDGTTGAPSSISGTWNFSLKCQANPQVVFSRDIFISQSGGSFSASGSGTDIDGGALSITISGNYAGSSGQLNGQLLVDRQGAGTRRDIFGTTLTSADTGFIGTTCQQNCNCPAEIRLFRR